MGKRFDTMLFPGGKDRAFTLSYDDGVIQDRRLAELFRSRELKCTFNLNYGILGHEEKGMGLDVSKLPVEEIGEVYRGHELGGHGYYHSALNTIGTPLALYEIVEDKRQLEKLAGKPMSMFAYPFGLLNDEVTELLRYAGYRGARTVVSTRSFRLPENFLKWDPTCHHNDAQLMELAQRFVQSFSREPQLFYVWGHAYEFDGARNWEVIEELSDFMAQQRDKVWFATNGEILDYVQAYRRLEYSVDGSMILNPSAIDVVIRTAHETVTLTAGSCTLIPDTPL